MCLKLLSWDILRPIVKLLSTRIHLTAHTWDIPVWSSRFVSDINIGPLLNYLICQIILAALSCSNVSMKWIQSVYRTHSVASKADVLPLTQTRFSNNPGLWKSHPWTLDWKMTFILSVVTLTCHGSIVKRAEQPMGLKEFGHVPSTAGKVISSLPTIQFNVVSHFLNSD